MQAKEILKRTGCSSPTLKQWIREGVIVPKTPGQGAGVHAVYDEANVVALAIAYAMKESLCVVVNKYSKGFEALQHWLRNHSFLEWGHYNVLLQTDKISLLKHKDKVSSVPLGIVVDLSKFMEAVAMRDNMGQQLPLLELESVR